jgi:hypothetical protein
VSPQRFDAQIIYYYKNDKLNTKVHHTSKKDEVIAIANEVETGSCGTGSSVNTGSSENGGGCGGATGDVKLVSRISIGTSATLLSKDASWRTRCETGRA